ncbi:MAG: antitermination protein NusG [Pseudomonadota bacterium]
MILKLLFTLGVIGIAWLVLRNRSRRGQTAANEQLARISRPSIQHSNSTPRLAAYGLIVFMILASGVVLYLQWRDQYRIVSVQVINTQTGLSESYEARLGDVEERQFQTLDGRIVNVADIERIEVGGLP